MPRALQVPAGLLADRTGAARVLTAGVALWSLAGGALWLAPASADPLRYMLASRAALGLAQSVLMPGVSAAAAQWFPPARRGRLVSSAYSCHSAGTVAGLVATPALAQAAGWPAAFAVLGAAGAAAAAAAWRGLPAERGAPGGGGGGPAAGGARRRALARPSAAALGSLALLCWTHSVISFGFFVLQAWIPTYLHLLGATDLRTLGLLSALPWAAAALTALAAGRAADWLQRRRGWPALRVRRAMQAGACLGGLALLPLAAAPRALPPAAAAACLTAAVACSGLNYAGFHSYVQDVAPADAGLVLGVTNTCGTLAGVAGTLATGRLLQSAGAGAVFAATAALYAAAAATWLACARGAPLRLTR